MIELVPNNTKRLIIKITRTNSLTGETEAAAGLTVTIRVAESSTATAGIGSMTYTATELTLQAGTYTVLIPGADIDSQLTANYMDTQVVIQVLESTNIKGFVDAMVRPVRRL